MYIHIHIHTIVTTAPRVESLRRPLQDDPCIAELLSAAEGAVATRARRLARL